jgi:hypothetical protein
VGIVAYDALWQTQGGSGSGQVSSYLVGRSKGDIPIEFGTPFVFVRDRLNRGRPASLDGVGLGFSSVVGNGQAPSPRSSERRRPHGQAAGSIGRRL